MTDSPMPFFWPPKVRYRQYGSPGHFLAAVPDLLLGRYRIGPGVDELEAEAARFLGARHAIAMPQARVGIFLALRALLKPGQKVVLSPYTIHDVINMVICAGGRPVFADIERQTCNVDARQVAELVDQETGAVMVTHLHGLACDIEEIAALCRERRVPLIEDAAQALGAHRGGKRLGTFGTAGVLSFGMAKNVNAFFGGMVVTDDDGLAARLRSDLGAFPYPERGLLLQRVAHCLVGEVVSAPPVFPALTYWIFRYGYLHGIDAITNRWKGEDEPTRKSEIPERYLRRMTPLQARLALHQLARVDADAETRRRYARAYHEGLRDIEPIVLPPDRQDGSHAFLSFPIQVPDRHALLRHLTRGGRDLTIQHIGNNADYACFADFKRDCPQARATADQVLLLPTYPSYGMRQVEKNVRLVRGYFGR
jgi:perosamine synthetase